MSHDQHTSNNYVHLPLSSSFCIPVLQNEINIISNKYMYLHVLSSIKFMSEFVANFYVCVGGGGNGGLDIAIRDDYVSQF